MKKYGFLLGATVLVIAAIVLVGRVGKKEVTVDLLTMQPRQAEQTVTCTGKIEAAKVENVYTDFACVAQEVFVKSGQEVKKGDVLFTVDADATRAVMMTAGMSAEQAQKVSIAGEMTSPIDGVVTYLNVHAGEPTTTKKPSVMIAADDTVRVRITIPESKLRDVKKGQRVNISGSAFGKKTYHGELTTIGKVAYTTAASSGAVTVVEAVVTLDSGEQDDTLRVGLTAKADIVIEEYTDSLVIPYETVLQDEDGINYVLTVKNGRAARREIVLGSELKDGILVTDGLSSGEQVIADPQSVKEGAVVREQAHA